MMILGLMRVMMMMRVDLTPIEQWLHKNTGRIAFLALLISFVNIIYLNIILVDRNDKIELLEHHLADCIPMVKMGSLIGLQKNRVLVDEADFASRFEEIKRKLLDEEEEEKDLEK